jgi:hypothetical protein
MRETDFQCEFLSIQAERLNRVLVKADLGALIAKVETLTAGVKRMAKADLDRPSLLARDQEAS